MTHREYRQLLKTDVSKAQRAVFDEYFNYVYAIVHNRLGNCGHREDIDECVSDVFIGAEPYASANSTISALLIFFS